MCCGAVVLSWLFNGSGGSVLIAALWHGTYNLVAATEASQGWIAAVVTTLVMLWAAGLVIMALRASRRGNAAAQLSAS